MNLLAHSFLSGENEAVKVGNLMGDFVKGKQYEDYPKEIQLGILLHRQIDHFTDHHTIVKESIEKLRTKYSKYAGVVVDVFYDHFLAIHFEKYAPTDLSEFADNSYKTFQKYKKILPEKIQKFLPNMIEHNWFANYANMEGMRRSFQSLDRRTNYRVNFENALVNLEQDFESFEQDFFLFFPDIQNFAQEYLESNFE